MQTLLYHSTTIAVVLVFLVLLAGLYTMLRGTSPNLSQKLMRWRVGLQFVAIIIIMAAVYVKKNLI
jgi:Hypoxia induced protein conserved region